MTKRVTLQLDPQVFELLKNWKKVIHFHASPKSLIGENVKVRKMPLSWNQFFTIVCTDWENGRTNAIAALFMTVANVSTPESIST